MPYTGSPFFFANCFNETCGRAPMCWITSSDIGMVAEAVSGRDVANVLEQGLPAVLLIRLVSFSLMKRYICAPQG
jgi:hypothetical protein